MSDQMLEKLFESEAKVRLLKLFMRNQSAKFTISQIKERSQLEHKTAIVALEKLREAGVLKAYTHFGKEARADLERKKFPKSKAISKTHKKKAEKTYFISPTFIFFDELRSLVLKSSPASKSRILKRVKGVGRIKLVVISGIFLKPDRELSRTDMLVVGDDVSEKRFLKFLKQLEAEIGCEVQFSLLNSDEFAYRWKMMDRFLRDIFDRPHETLINKLGV